MKEDKGVKMFYDEMQWVYKTRSGAALAIMQYLMFMTSWNSPEFYLSPQAREEMTSFFGMHRSTVSRAITELIGWKAIARDMSHEAKRGHYVLNPKMMWHGDLSARPAAIRKYRSLFYGDDSE